MKKFLVKYTVTTKSTHGSYIYKGKREIEAENEEALHQYVKENAPSWYGFKRCSVSIKSIIEVQ